jgi:hypothetical protein
MYYVEERFMHLTVSYQNALHTYLDYGQSQLYRLHNRKTYYMAN